jgi:uncharacterized protein
MKTVFMDSNYLIALINPLDQWHKRARRVQREIGVVQLLTSEWVMVETLNYFAERGEMFRRAATKLAHRLTNNPLVEIIPATHEDYRAGFALYEARLDKGYSLTDCVSMNLMRERGINEVLTHDRHFAQEGFTVLL